MSPACPATAPATPAAGQDGRASIAGLGNAAFRGRSSDALRIAAEVIVAALDRLRSLLRIRCDCLRRMRIEARRKGPPTASALERGATIHGVAQTKTPHRDAGFRCDPDPGGRLRVRRPGSGFSG